MAELVKRHEYDLKRFTLIPSDGGAFEVKIDDEMIYSKLGTGRHAEPGEVENLVTQHIKKEG
jgi:selenoprotein W-related protein